MKEQVATILVRVPVMVVWFSQNGTEQWLTN